MNNNDFDGRGIHLTHLNIRSLWNKFSLFENYLQNNNNITVFGLSKSWLKTDHIDGIIEINGYNSYRNDRKWNDRQSISPKKGGGVKNTVISNAYELAEFNMSTIDMEIQWITLVHPRMNNICIANLYRPPQGNIKKCCDQLENQMNAVKNKYTHEPEIFILGDYNIDFLKPRDPNTKLLKWIEQSTGLKQQIKFPTRYCTINSCIDLIFTNCQKINKVQIHNLNISDHQMISITRKHLTKPSISNWNLFYNTRNPSIARSILYEIIENIVDYMCPQKQFNIKKMRDPWITDELLEILFEKDRLLLKAKHSQKEEDWATAKIARNEANILIRNSKSDFIQNNLELHRNDAKKNWKNLNVILPQKNSKKNKLINLKDEFDNPITNNTEASNFMNEFFVSIGPKLSKKWDQNQWSYYGVYSNNEIPEMTTNDIELRNVCLQIDITKSSAIPGLSSRILKDAFYV